MLIHESTLTTYVNVMIYESTLEDAMVYKSCSAGTDSRIRALILGGSLASPDPFLGALRVYKSPATAGTDSAPRRICIGILAARLSCTIRCRSDGDDESEFS